jgi:hypothetical protein
LQEAHLLLLFSEVTPNMPREKEYPSVAAYPFASAEGDVNVVTSLPDTSIRLPPMYRRTPRSSPRWKADFHFHVNLKVDAPVVDMAVEKDPETVVPKVEEAKDADVSTMEGVKEEVTETKPSEETKDGDTEKAESPAPVSQPSTSLCLTFEAMAQEGIAVALSPNPRHTGGKTYEIFYGDRGNTNTLIERRQKVGGGKIHVSTPGRHCTETQWTAYWIAMHQGKIYAGIGSQPPEKCVGVLDDLALQDRPISATAWYVGIGNSSMKREGERGFANHYRNVKLAPLSAELQESLTVPRTDVLPIVNVGEDEMDDETKALLKEYEEECRKSKARADKFGLAYKEPPSFLPWSQVRRMRANPNQGFITGFDVTDPAEKSKQEARRKRFGLAAMETEDKPAGAMEGLPMIQAWDNEKLIRGQRMDPPRKLWKVPPSESGEDMADEDPFASETVEYNPVPEKLHLFAIDWAAFKQIRTTDVSAYFSMYSPTYVEWLGDLSCNVHFQDRFSATRALENLSQEILTPPPPVEVVGAEEAEKSPDLGAMGWRFGKTMLLKISDDRHGRRGTSSRILLRGASSRDILREKPPESPRPPPGFSRNRVLGPGSDFAPRSTGKSKRSRGESEQEETSSNPLAPGEEPSLLGGSLKAGRSGFSVEDMEAERATKRARVSEGKSNEN